MQKVLFIAQEASGRYTSEIIKLKNNTNAIITLTNKEQNRI